jgi:3-oxoacyl-[acyl-carrier protein] reductase
MALKPAPDYVSPHGLLEGKSVLVTAAAGAGIGFAAAGGSPRKVAVRCSSRDVHERRLGEAVESLKRETGLTAVHGQLCDVSKRGPGRCPDRLPPKTSSAASTC